MGGSRSGRRSSPSSSGFKSLEDVVTAGFAKSVTKIWSSVKMRIEERCSKVLGAPKGPGAKDGDMNHPVPHPQLFHGGFETSPLSFCPTAGDRTSQVFRNTKKAVVGNRMFSAPAGYLFSSVQSLQGESAGNGTKS
jgi:hypothetical protein